MRSTALLLLSVSFLSGYAHAAAPAAYNAVSAVAPSDSTLLDTPFTVRSKTQVPGGVLAPGSYIITIKDSLTDRVILQIKRDGKVASTFLGVFDPGAPAHTSGPITLPIDSGNMALQGFSFAGGRTVEFVYPKAEAAAIANRTPSEVLAIDPPSDNLKAKADNSLSTEDAKIVTLWSLKATRVSSTEKGIAAKKWVPQQQEPVVAAADSASPAPRAPQKRPSPAGTAVAANRTTVADRPAAADRPAVAASRVPALKALPHTASNMPLLLLSALVSLMAAALLRFGRSVGAVR